MYTKEDILARLQAGETAQYIADEIAANLNNALSEYTKQKKAKEELNQKLQDANQVVSTLMDFAEKYYPEVYSDDIRAEMTGETLIKIADESLEEVRKFKKTLSGLEELFSDLKDNEKDPIEKFLAEHGLN